MHKSRRWKNVTTAKINDCTVYYAVMFGVNSFVEEYPQNSLL